CPAGPPHGRYNRAGSVRQSMRFAYTTSTDQHRLDSRHPADKAKLFERGGNFMAMGAGRGVGIGHWQVSRLDDDFSLASWQTQVKQGFATDSCARLRSCADQLAKKG